MQVLGLVTLIAPAERRLDRRPGEHPCADIEGVIVKEGGTNLLIKRFGRTVVPARELNKDAFTSIDTRTVHEIGVPDSSKHYRIVSRQSLDDVKVGERDGTTFRGPLEIPDAEKFWSASRYLIIVER